MAMSRFGGVAALQRHIDSQESYRALSTSLSKTQVENLRSQLNQFRSALTRFAIAHREEIKRDAAFRHAFQQMCASIGVDPLAGPPPGVGSSGGDGQKKGIGSGIASTLGGWWGELTGLGDWYLELGVQIVDICVNKRDSTGGLIEMDYLVRLLCKLRSSTSVTAEDVERSIKTLKPLGAGYEVIDVGGRKMVRNVPKELDADQAVVLAYARDEGGRVSERELAAKTGWTVVRARVALENMLLRDGLCWVDEQDERIGKSYWVISVMKWEE